MPKCMICGRILGQINNMHLNSHDITAEEYKKKFPGEILIPPSEKRLEAAKKNLAKRKDPEKFKKDLIERNKSTDMREKVSKSMTGKKKSEKHKKALKDAKSREDKEKRAEINGDNRRGKPQPEEMYKKMIISIKKRRNTIYKVGERKDLNNTYFRSSWEANFARVLNLLMIDWEFESKSFLVTLNGGRVSRYMPDFYLPKLNKFIEIKGRWNEESKEKFDLFKEQYPEIRIDVIDGSKYKAYERRFKHQIDEWE